MRKPKSTMVELVEELEKLWEVTKHPGIPEMIEEAKAGEYHDYKNKKYACGKVESYTKLMRLGFHDLANRIKNGEFDEEADEEDKKMMREDLLAGGFNESQLHVFGL